MKIADIALIVSEKNGVPIDKITHKEMAKWIINAQGIDLFKSAISEDYFIQVPLKRNYKGKKFVEHLRHGPAFAGTANALAEADHSKEAETVFCEVLARTPHDFLTLNDYGALIGTELIIQYNHGRGIDKSRLMKAKKAISEAAILSSYALEEYRLCNAYKTMALTRQLEALSQHYEGEHFTAFILGWLSIEMALNHLWYKTAKEAYGDKVSKAKMDALERWNIDTVLEALYITQKDSPIGLIKHRIDALRGIRNDIFHCKLFTISEGDSLECMTIAYELNLIVAGLKK